MSPLGGVDCIYKIKSLKVYYHTSLLLFSFSHLLSLDRSMIIHTLPFLVSRFWVFQTYDKSWSTKTPGYVTQIRRQLEPDLLEILGKQSKWFYALFNPKYPPRSWIVTYLRFVIIHKRSSTRIYSTYSLINSSQDHVVIVIYIHFNIEWSQMVLWLFTIRTKNPFKDCPLVIITLS